MSDASRRGISFVTASGPQLSPGDTITVTANQSTTKDRAGNMLAYSVRRVEPYDEYLSLVACTRRRR